MKTLIFIAALAAPAWAGCAWQNMTVDGLAATAPSNCTEGNDACYFHHDGTCDDSNGLCAPGTDCTDCAALSRRSLAEDADADSAPSMIDAAESVLFGSTMKTVKQAALDGDEEMSHLIKHSGRALQTTTIRTCDINNLRSGRCGAFWSRSSCWERFAFSNGIIVVTRDFCCATRSGDCCERNGAGIAGIVVGSIIFTCCVIMAFVACFSLASCKDCPCNKHNNKNATNRNGVQMASVTTPVATPAATPVASATPAVAVATPVAAVA
mmetsp:Transcript_8445/g.16976  ORF Transcript_8445/g.16976 Transcript_8445/m.16976 type:complete len:267 (+) Transcript_8445:27-827(+)|eukprot:CAMPEP_0119090918 /NCGR_PEP_ID=MMETSP1178-20130426/154508_1 /TAXON_ID=33656 /ORGANISM="unid sp, Strain CCMP2000" /LENGTH=266 /DNA_ID=CAMNT_0007074379 /DNA_START=27 /DNA_END=827 /DNA_ORIENTATION=+